MEMRKLRLPFRALCLWETLLFLLLAALLIVIYVIFVPFTWLWYLLVGSITGLYLLFALGYLPLFYRSVGVELDDKKIVYEGGVLFHKRKVLPKNQLVTVHLIQDPLSALFRVASVRCNVPGASLALFHLERQDAQQLQRSLLEHCVESGEV